MSVRRKWKRLRFNFNHYCTVHCAVTCTRRAYPSRHLRVIDRSVGSGAAGRCLCARAYVLRTRYYYCIYTVITSPKTVRRTFLFISFSTAPRPLFPVRHVASTTPRQWFRAYFCTRATSVNRIIMRRPGSPQNPPTTFREIH